MTVGHCIYFFRKCVPFVKEHCDLTSLEGVTSAMLAIKGIMRDVDADVRCRIVYGDPNDMEGAVIRLPSRSPLFLEVTAA